MFIFFLDLKEDDPFLEVLKHNNILLRSSWVHLDVSRFQKSRPITLTPLELFCMICCS